MTQPTTLPIFDLDGIRKQWENDKEENLSIYEKLADEALEVIRNGANASFSFGKLEEGTINGIKALVFRDFVWSTTSGTVKMDRCELWVLSWPDLDLYTKLFRREDITDNLRQLILMNVKDYCLDV